MKFGFRQGWHLADIRLTCLFDLVCLLKEWHGSPIKYSELWLSTCFNISTSRNAMTIMTHDCCWSSSQACYFGCILNDRTTGPPFWILDCHLSTQVFSCEFHVWLGGRWWEIVLDWGTRCARIASVVCQLPSVHSMRMLWQPTTQENSSRHQTSDSRRRRH